MQNFWTRKTAVFILVNLIVLLIISAFSIAEMAGGLLMLLGLSVPYTSIILMPLVFPIGYIGGPAVLTSFISAVLVHWILPKGLRLNAIAVVILLNVSIGWAVLRPDKDFYRVIHNKDYTRAIKLINDPKFEINKDIHGFEPIYIAFCAEEAPSDLANAMLKRTDLILQDSSDMYFFCLLHYHDVGIFKKAIEHKNYRPSICDLTQVVEKGSEAQIKEWVSHYRDFVLRQKKFNCKDHVRSVQDFARERNDPAILQIVLENFGPNIYPVQR